MIAFSSTATVGGVARRIRFPVISAKNRSPVGPDLEDPSARMIPAPWPPLARR